MLGRQDRWQEDLFVAAPLRELIPADHPLRKIDRILDLSWLRAEVAECYCLDNGRPGIDPEAAVRLMLAGLIEGIVHDRKLMRQAQVNLAIRWFAGYRLTDKLPDASSFTKIRARWGEERFRRIFLRTVSQCVGAGLVAGETIHVDATLIRADASWDSLTRQYVEKVIETNGVDVLPEDDDPDDPSRPDDPPQDPAKGKGKVKKVSRTDPEASMATSCRTHRLEPSYKQHTAVDSQAGVVVDVVVTTGQVSEGKHLVGQIDRVEANIGQEIYAVSADKGYAHSANYAELLRRDIEHAIPPQKPVTRKGRMPLSRFRYDAMRDEVRCPRKKRLLAGSHSGSGRWFRSNPKDCRNCPLHDRCIPAGKKRRQILISDDYVALLAARRAAARRDETWLSRQRRHRVLVEGAHGEAKAVHGLSRAARRGRWNVAIQSYLTAAVMNLKRLAGLAGPLKACFVHSSASWRSRSPLWPPSTFPIGPDRRIIENRQAA